MPRGETTKALWANPEYRRLMIAAARRKWNKVGARKILSERNKKMGITPPSRLGVMLSKETRLKMSIAHKGSKSHLWRGGITKPDSYYSKKRRAIKMGAIGVVTLADWETLKAQYDWTCPCCGKREPMIKLTQDHIIPLSRGGSNNIENIQPLCSLCNSKKYTSIIKFNVWRNEI